MMTQKQKFRYVESDSLQIVELPYVGDDLSMVALLPKEIDGLNELEGALTMESLARWTSGLWEREVTVLLPRFTMNSEFRLDSTLTSMGMIDAFDQDRANFSGMDGREQWLYIAAAIHKTFIDVNEEGTEAAAAAAVVTTARSMPTPLFTFRADHPFLFLIRENHTGSILFLGRVVKPVPRAA
jgi:serpin B